MVAVEGFRREKSNEGRLRFVGVGLELEPSEPLQVADAGNLGGGISLCLGGCGACSVFETVLCGCGAFEAWVAALEEARRQPLKLSFLLRDDPDEGVSGSVDAEV